LKLHSNSLKILSLRCVFEEIYIKFSFWCLTWEFERYYLWNLRILFVIIDLTTNRKEDWEIKNKLEFCQELLFWTFVSSLLRVSFKGYSSKRVNLLTVNKSFEIVIEKKRRIRKIIISIINFNYTARAFIKVHYIKHDFFWFFPDFLFSLGK
jgi:hypothetical protein